MSRMLNLIWCTGMASIINIINDMTQTVNDITFIKYSIFNQVILSANECQFYNFKSLSQPLIIQQMFFTIQVCLLLSPIFAY